MRCRRSVRLKPSLESCWTLLRERVGIWERGGRVTSVWAIAPPPFLGGGLGAAQFDERLTVVAGGWDPIPALTRERLAGHLAALLHLQHLESRHGLEAVRAALKHEGRGLEPIALAEEPVDLVGLPVQQVLWLRDSGPVWTDTALWDRVPPAAAGGLAAHRPEAYAALLAVTAALQAKELC